MAFCEFESGSSVAKQTWQFLMQVFRCNKYFRASNAFRELFALRCMSGVTNDKLEHIEHCQRGTLYSSEMSLSNCVSALWLLVTI
jgi:hypothetical protein